jgi:hypothetical protein
LHPITSDLLDIAKALYALELLEMDVHKKALELSCYFSIWTSEPQFLNRLETTIAAFGIRVPYNYALLVIFN